MPFLTMLLLNLLQSGCEIFTAFLVGTPGNVAATLFWIADFINYACGSLLFITFGMYLMEYLSLKSSISHKPFLLIVVLGVANILLMAAEPFLQMFGSLDANNYYVPTDAIWITLISPMLTVCVFIVVILQNRKNCLTREWVSLLLYVLIPVLCYGIEMAFPGVWVVCLGGAISMFLLFVNIQVELKYRLHQQDEELAESRIAVMLSQIQPHFLYNALSAIEDLCGIDVEKAKIAVNDFAHYLRGNLDSLNRRELIPFEDELEHIETYAGLEKLRFGEQLQVIYDIETEDFVLPPLTVQPIVENAIRYGVTKKSGGGTVSISVKKREGAITITVADDGIGFDPTVPKQDGREHVGIDNVRARLERLCGGSLAVHSEPGVGTTAVIVIPGYEGGI